MPNEDLSNLASEQEMKFFEAYLGTDSKTRGNAEASAIEAGYAARNAASSGSRILKRFKDISFDEAAERVGLSNMHLAMKLKKNVDSSKATESNAAIKLTQQLKGKLKGDTSTESSDVVNAPMQLVSGVDVTARLKALRTGKPIEPEIAVEEIEDESAEA